LGKEFLKVSELLDRIRDCLPRAVKLAETGFRSAGVRYANESDFVSGDGAAYYGGRWNPPGMKAVYMSLDPFTATKESYQEFAKFGFKDNIKPRVLAGARLKLRR